jgi:GalNAc-alpha-(1->4)-GalNAc-alpha-(1->3)-diNAcBac-PP-undecaprenol alpha-1,4-N-acetyl-D-galactosaminyltransferase
MRITLVISSLQRGGAERVMSMLASSWAEQGKEVTLLTLERDETSAYPIHPSVKRCDLGLSAPSVHILQGLFANFRRIWILRRAIRASRPDIVISFMDQTNVLTVIATRGLSRPVVISERTSPRRRSIGRIWSSLRRLSYPFADLLICPTRACLTGFQAMTKVRGTVIPNPVAVSIDLELRHHVHHAGNVLVAMGRLVPEKGFDLLLEAFARIASRHPKWSLTIIGKGPLRGELNEQTRALKLTERVHFAGELTDPFPALCAADLFVLSSRFEGFPMALAEAMACGLPVISFDCSEGPSDIIRNGVDGILVPGEDVSGLATALDRLMSDSQERARLAARAPEVMSRFSREQVLSQWQQLFNELLSAKGNFGLKS